MSGRDAFPARSVHPIHVLNCKIYQQLHLRGVSHIAWILREQAIARNKRLSNLREGGGGKQSLCLEDEFLSSSFLIQFSSHHRASGLSDHRPSSYDGIVVMLPTTQHVLQVPANLEGY